MQFSILLPNGNLITEQTVLKTKSGDTVKLTDHYEIALFIYNKWKRQTVSTSFQNWADELNADENFSENGENPGFTTSEALDNLASMYVLNIDKQHIELYNFMKNCLPKEL